MPSVEFLRHLPKPNHTKAAIYDVGSDPWFKDCVEAKATQLVFHKKTVPPYGRRTGFTPRKVEDFGDGGAFPEIDVRQYPLDMGSEEQGINTKILPVTVDAKGNVDFDIIVKQSENASKIVYSKHSDLIPKVLTEVSVKRPDEEEVQETTERTKAALEKIVSASLSTSQPKSVPNQNSAPSYIKYTPSQQSAAFNSGAKERVIRMAEMPKDPLELPKFKHKRVPKAAGSPPVPLMHSPPRPATVKDRQDWKIPPCISNWKNSKGYTIPLDKRLAADGRGLQEVQINDNFAKLAEALYVSEQMAREAVNMRSKIQRELMTKEREKKEQDLRMFAQRARIERAVYPGVGPERVGPGMGVGLGPGDRKMEDSDAPRAVSKDEQQRASKEEREERLKREAIREERRRDRERERRLESKEGVSRKKSKITRDRGRDISEKVALGMANTGATGGEMMYDQRLFNQEQGMESGFAADDSYNVYDKGLFNSQNALGGLYRPSKNVDSEVYGGEQLDKVLKTDRFRADKGFAGAADGKSRDNKPLAFEGEEADPFGLDHILTEVKKGKKALDRVGGGGTMRASAGSGARETYEGGSSRYVDFERGGR